MSNYTEIAATVTSLQEQLTKVLDEVTALRRAAKSYAVGDVIDAEDAGNLPYGASFRDRDDDVWFANGQGDYAWSMESLADRDFTACRVEDYAPFTIVGLPEEEKELIGVHHEVGDTVKLLPGADRAIFAFGFGNYPAEVVISNGPREVEGHGTCYDVHAVGASMTQVVPVRFLEAIPEAEPAGPAEAEIVLSDRTVRARRSGATSGVRLEVINTGHTYYDEAPRQFVHLSVDDTKVLAETLASIVAAAGR